MRNNGNDSKKYIAQFVDNLILAFESANQMPNGSYSYFEQALTIATKTFEVEKSAIFYQCDDKIWRMVITVGEAVNAGQEQPEKPCCKTETSYEDTCALELFVADNYDQINNGETFTTNLINNYNNITLIPFRGSGINYCLALINKKNHIEPGLLYLQQHYRLFTALFGFASAGTASLLSLWRESLFAGSRSTIIERANDFIKSFANTPKGQSFDFILATGIDAATQLKIIPHRQTTSISENAFESITPSGKDIPPYTNLALLRRDIWLQSQAGFIYDDTIKTICEALCTSSISSSLFFNEHSPEPQLENSILDSHMSSKLAKFLFDHYYEIEQTRTHLFLIYHMAFHQENVIDGNQLQAIDSLFCDEFNGNSLQKKLIALLENYLKLWSENSNGSLIITSEWLYFWFGLKMLKSVSLFVEVGKKYPPDFRANFYQHFSCYYLYMLFLFRCLGEPALFRFSDVPGGYESFVSSSIFLMAEYTHQEEGLNTTVPLHSALQNIWAKEAILYSVRDSYRDHFHHVWNVCLLGMVFVDAGLLAKIDPNWYSYNENDKEQIRRNWILAGLLHDIGYCLDLNSHMLGHLDVFAKVPNIASFSKQLAGFINQSEKELCATMATLCTCYEGHKLDHGVTSSVYLNYLDRLDDKAACSSPSQAWSKDIAMATEAIAKHNLKNVPIKPQESPMAFLLLLCDHLQEWDRPRLSGDKLRRSFSVQLHRPRQGQSMGHDIVRRLESNLKWTKNGISLTDNTLSLTLVYKDAVKEEFEPAMIWCQNSEDFQHLDLSSFPFDFYIEFSSLHPLSYKLEHLSRTEMQLFEDFCRQDDARLHLVQWCYNSRNVSKNYVYNNSSHPISERYIWKFCKTNFLDKIEYFPSGLYTEFTQWKERTVRKLQVVNARQNT